jgi:hypothetical protein
MSKKKRPIDEIFDRPQTRPEYKPPKSKGPFSLRVNRKTVGRGTLKEMVKLFVDQYFTGTVQIYYFGEWYCSYYKD